MLLKSIQFKNFKRFSDLTIDLDPTNSGQIPKLVLLIGTNGSGKSSVFDGFEVVSQYGQFKNGFNLSLELPANPTLIVSEDFSELQNKYYNKNQNKGTSLKAEFNKNQNLKIETAYKNNQIFFPNLFYGRTAFRHIPEITKTQIGGSQDVKNPRSVDYDYEKSYYDMDLYFAKLIQETQTGEAKIGKEFNQKVSKAFNNIFGKKTETSLKYKLSTAPLQSEDGIKPHTPINFLFEKNGKELTFTHLSAGEKQIFLVLFNLFNREIHTGKYSIIYIDELDAHLNTALQKNLLQEITENWIPDGCQLWTASHSLGFIEYAREYDKGAIIDFDNLDFDLPQKLEPVKNFDLQIYEVSIPKQTLGKILLDQQIYFCEGTNDEIYNSLGFEKTIFIGGRARNKDEVLFELKNTKYKGIIDRDYLTDAEIANLKKEYNNKLFVLDFYAIENYLYHWENLLEIDSNFKVLEYQKRILEVKQINLVNMEITASRKMYRCLKHYPTEKLNKESAKIKEILNSNQIEVFYPYFDVKKYLNPKPNFKISQLIQTQWFKNQIQKVILG